MPLDANAVGRQSWFMPAQPIVNAPNPFQDPFSQAFLKANQVSPIDLLRGVAHSFGNMAQRTQNAFHGQMIPREDYGPATFDTANTMLGAGPAGALAANTRTPFFSALHQAIEKAPLAKAPGDQWLGTLKNTPAVKPDEIDWTGMGQFLKGKPSVTKQDALSHLDANKVDVQEVWKGEKGNTVYDGAGGMVGDTKFSQWQLPGGENYKELLLTLPVKKQSVPIPPILDRLPEGYELIHDAGRYGVIPPGQLHARSMVGMHSTPEEATRQALNHVNEEAAQNYYQQMQDARKTAFRSGHYDEPNVLAHIRMNDRVDANGKKTLFLEEVQSDWHQRGRKHGYAAGPVKLDENGMVPGDQVRDFVNKVPDAPFKKDWHELALKRAIKYAADNGYDQVAWTPGKVQAERYPNELRQTVTRIEWHDTPAHMGKWKDGEIGSKEVVAPRKDGNGAVKFYVNENGVVTHGPTAEFKGKTVEDVIGKEMAERVMQDKSGDIAAPDFVIGSKGMQGFYDKMLPAAANKLGKKYGAKVGVTKIGVPDSTYPQETWTVDTGTTPTVKAGQHEVWSLPITDTMRSEVGAKGMPLFTGANPLSAAAIGQQQTLSPDQARAYMRGNLL